MCRATPEGGMGLTREPKRAEGDLRGAVSTLDPTHQLRCSLMSRPRKEGNAQRKGLRLVDKARIASNRAPIGEAKLMISRRREADLTSQTTGTQAGPSAAHIYLNCMNQSLNEASGTPDANRGSLNRRYEKLLTYLESIEELDARFQMLVRLLGNQIGKRSKTIKNGGGPSTENGLQFLKILAVD